MSRATSEERDAVRMLRLLLDGVPTPAPQHADWDRWRRLALRNAVLVRLADRLAAAGTIPPDGFGVAAERARRHMADRVARMRQIAANCERHGIAHLFLKLAQHYPDYGRDVDLLVEYESLEPDRLLLEGLRAQPGARGLSKRLTGTASYRLDGDGIVLDVHHARLGQFGEHLEFPRIALRRRRLCDIGGLPFWAPAPEDHVVLLGIEGVYKRSEVRLGDAVETIRVLRSGLDWDYVLGTARQIGVYAGLCCHLAFVDQIHRETFGCDALPGEVRRQLRLDGWGRVAFADGTFRFSPVLVGGRLYVRQLGATLRARRWRGAGRLCLVPLVAAALSLKRLVFGTSRAGVPEP